MANETQATSIKSFLLPFAVALVLCSAGFLLLDVLVMNMQGLSLIYHE